MKIGDTGPYINFHERDTGRSINIHEVEYQSPGNIGLLKLYREITKKYDPRDDHVTLAMLDHWVNELMEQHPQGVDEHLADRVRQLYAVLGEDVSQMIYVASAAGDAAKVRFAKRSSAEAVWTDQGVVFEGATKPTAPDANQPVSKLRPPGSATGSAGDGTARLSSPAGVGLSGRQFVGNLFFSGSNSSTVVSDRTSQPRSRLRASDTGRSISIHEVGYQAPGNTGLVDLYRQITKKYGPWDDHVTLAMLDHWVNELMEQNHQGIDEHFADRVRQLYAVLGEDVSQTIYVASAAGDAAKVRFAKRSPANVIWTDQGVVFEPETKSKARDANQRAPQLSPSRSATGSAGKATGRRPAPTGVRLSGRQFVGNLSSPVANSPTIVSPSVTVDRTPKPRSPPEVKIAKGVDDGLSPDELAAKLIVLASGATEADGRAVLAELRKLPPHVLQSVYENGTKVVACRDSITNHVPRLKEKKPRGWPPGKSWDNAPGVYDPKGNEVVVATQGEGNRRVVPRSGRSYGGASHGCYNLVLHETMHAYDFLHRPRLSEDPAFRRAWEQDLGVLSSYEQQPGKAGPQEAFAEHSSKFFSLDFDAARRTPHLFALFASGWPEKRHA